MPKFLRNLMVVVAALSLLSLMFVSFFGRSGITFLEDKLGIVTMSVSRVFASVGNFMDEKVEPFFNVLAYKKSNENLLKQNEALKEEVIRLTLTRKDIADLEELKNALNMTKRTDQRRLIGANVIAKDPGNWFNSFVVDVGSSDGVTKNSAVINGQGLVGIVYEVGETWAKVLSIVDQRSSVAFEMVKSKDDFDGVISGTKDFRLMCEFYDPDAVYEVGDFLMTSGIGVYPEGIMIGKIAQRIDDAAELSRKAMVEPVVDFRKIQKVLIIKYEERK